MWTEITGIQQARVDSSPQIMVFRQWVVFFGSIYFTQALVPSQGALVGVSLTRSLGVRTSAGLNTTAPLNSLSRPSFSSAQIQQSLQDEPGVGYRVLAQQGALPRLQAGVFLQSYWNTVQLELDTAGNIRVSCQGTGNIR